MIDREREQEFKDLGITAEELDEEDEEDDDDYADSDRDS
jgi:hypothetical protein